MSELSGSDTLSAVRVFAAEPERGDVTKCADLHCIRLTIAYADRPGIRPLCTHHKTAEQQKNANRDIYRRRRPVSRAYTQRRRQDILQHREQARKSQAEEFADELEAARQTTYTAMMDATNDETMRLIGTNYERHLKPTALRHAAVQSADIDVLRQTTEINCWRSPTVAELARVRHDDATRRMFGYRCDPPLDSVEGDDRAPGSMVLHNQFMPWCAVCVTKHRVYSAEAGEHVFTTERGPLLADGSFGPPVPIPNWSAWHVAQKPFCNICLERSYARCTRCFTAWRQYCLYRWNAHRDRAALSWLLPGSTSMRAAWALLDLAPEYLEALILKPHTSWLTQSPPQEFSPEQDAQTARWQAEQDEWEFPHAETRAAIQAARTCAGGDQVRAIATTRHALAPLYAEINHESIAPPEPWMLRWAIEAAAVNAIKGLDPSAGGAAPADRLPMAWDATRRRLVPTARGHATGAHAVHKPTGLPPLTMGDYEARINGAVFPPWSGLVTNQDIRAIRRANMAE